MSAFVDRPLRVAFVVAEFPSHTETFIAAQIRGLVERGHDVHVYALERPESDAAGTIQCRYARPVAAGRPGRWRALLRMLRDRKIPLRALFRSLRFGREGAVAVLRFATSETQRYDIIHAHFGPVGIQAAALRAAGVIDGRLIVTFHGHDVSAFVRQRGERVYDALFAAADLCLPVTARWERTLLALGCPPGKVRVHAMGVDCRALRPVSRPIRDVPTVITVARLVEKKGIEYAIRAAALLGGRRFRLIIVGDGPERTRLERLIVELGVADRVELTGWRAPDVVHAMLAAADIALLPSVTAANGDQEGLPVSIMEAMAVGLPVIATDHSGIPELVRHDVEGYLVPERDPAAIAERVALLLERPDLRTSLGSAARTRVEQRHDQAALDELLVQHYVRLASRPAAAHHAGAGA